MLYNQNELDSEIKDLHLKILERRKAFEDGMKRDVVFSELRDIYAELKELHKRLDACFQESNALREA